VEYNGATWVRAGFGSAGEVRVLATPCGWRISVHIEGVPAHDPGYVASVRRDFLDRFVKPGWGMLASGTVRARVLAGDLQNGRPRPQWVSLPALSLRPGEDRQ
jgi:hypothetical protein